MQIYFCGLKNAGYESYTTKGKYGETPDKFVRILNVQLTDDFNGKDLTEYRNVLRKSEQRGIAGNYDNPVSGDFLNLRYVFFNCDKKPKLFINGKNIKNEDELDKALPLVVFAQKMIDKADNTPVHKMKVENSYLKSDKADRAIYLGNPKERVSDFFYYDRETDEYMQDLHDTVMAKGGISYFNNVLKNLLTNFLSENVASFENGRKSEISDRSLEYLI